MTLFSAAGLAQAMTTAGIEPVSFAAADPLVAPTQELSRIESRGINNDSWHLELALSRRPEFADWGEHIVAVCCKRR